MITILALTGCLTTAPPDVVTTVQGSGAVTTRESLDGVTDPSDDFDAFVERSFAAVVARQPEMVTGLGLDGELGTRPSHLDDLSPAFLDATARLVDQTLAELHSFDFEKLTLDQKVSYLAWEWHLEQMVSLHPHRLREWPVHFLLNSYNQGLISLLTEVHPLGGEQDIEDFIARLEAVRGQVASVVTWMEDAEAAGALPPSYVVEATIDRLRGDIAGGNPTATAVYARFRDRAALLDLPEARLEELAAKVEAALATSFIPAWEILIEHLESVSARAGAEIGLSRQPGGDAYYQSLIRYHTSTDLTPVEIHEIGWVEVDRVRAEMRELAASAGLDTEDIGSIREHFSEAAGFVEDTEVVGSYEEIIAEATESFAPYFGVVPEAPLVIVPDPGPTAYYIGPAVDGSRPGSFHAGTGGRGAPVYTMRSLAFHEAVPGHHFQIALAQETDLPAPQRFLTNTGHVEGWALYAERLAADIGVYEDDPAGDFGRLDFELLRAARLIVDTGIHDLGWSRSEALETMTEIIDGDRFNHEIDRYVLYPGQATAYMVGMLAILDLRSASGASIEDADALAAFHQQIIGRGNLPMTVIARLPGLIDG